MIRALLFACVATALAAQESTSRPSTRTTAERTSFAQTSAHQDVLDFLAAIHSPRVVVRNFGKTGEGKPMPVAIVSDPPCDPNGVVRDRRLRVLIVANIHGGEVEGKEVAQMLVRECAAGEHAAILKECVLLVVPNFNADGNDKIDKKNRVSQNGPDGGVGRRENAQGLDLNRDFVKLETPEARALVALMNRFDPHVLLDLHTTNGSYHGWHVTYATSLSPNVDPGIAKLATETWIPELRASLEKDHGVRAFHYGNFENDKDGPVWASFEPHPRFLTNYFGLRHGLALLCEAYSYLPFEKRVSATRAFVLEALRATCGHRDEILGTCYVAARGVTFGPIRRSGLAFGFASELGPAVEDEVLRGSVERVKVTAGTRLVAKDEFTKERMRVRSTFVAKESLPLPQAWAILSASEATRDTLLAHGLVVEQLTAPAHVSAESFAPSEIRKQRSFQKHTPVAVRGTWREIEVTLPIGTLVIDASRGADRLAMLGAQLLEPQSDDSLATWNHFDSATRVATQAALDPANLKFPVLRLRERIASGKQQLVETAQPAGSTFAAAARALSTYVVGVKLICEDLGLAADGSIDQGKRKINVEIGPKKHRVLSTVEAELTRLAGHLETSRVDLRTGKALPNVINIEPFRGINAAEVQALVEIVERTGFVPGPIDWR